MTTRNESLAVREGKSPPPVPNLLREPGGKARFADPRFARDQHDVALAAPRAVPARRLREKAAGVSRPDEG
jgi:hypothetical protein